MIPRAPFPRPNAAINARLTNPAFPGIFKGA
jgi:hypothetical protein